MSKPNVVQIQMPDEWRAKLKQRAAALFMAEGTYARTLLVGALARLDREEQLGVPERKPSKKGRR